MHARPPYKVSVWHETTNIERVEDPPLAYANTSAVLKLAT
jgi:hypothetical protein